MLAGSDIRDARSPKSCGRCLSADAAVVAYPSYGRKAKHLASTHLLGEQHEKGFPMTNEAVSHWGGAASLSKYTGMELPCRTHDGTAPLERRNVVLFNAITGEKKTIVGLGMEKNLVGPTIRKDPRANKLTSAFFSVYNYY